MKEGDTVKLIRPLNLSVAQRIDLSTGALGLVQTVGVPPFSLQVSPRSQASVRFNVGRGVWVSLPVTVDEEDLVVISPAQFLDNEGVLQQQRGKDAG